MKPNKDDCHLCTHYEAPCVCKKDLTPDKIGYCVKFDNKVIRRTMLGE